MIENIHPIADEGIRAPKRFEATDLNDRKLFEAAFGFVRQRVDEGMAAFYDPMEFPPASSRNCFYEPAEDYGWTNAFWTGQLWLCYEMTGYEKYKEFALREVNTYYTRRIEEQLNTDQHDIGFLYILSAKPAWLLLKDRHARELTLKAAELLKHRFWEKGGILQAVGDLSDPKEQGIYIVDSVMNASLLYWAAEETNDGEFRRIADIHMKQVARNSVKEDASCYHKIRMGEDGQVKERFTGQGYSFDGCWARGLSWLQYGFTLAYEYTGETGYLDVAGKVNHYFLNRLPEDFVCYWDLYWTEGPEEKDSSAAAIAACALLEYGGCLKDDGIIYKKAAYAIIKSLSENYLTRYIPSSNGILQHGVYSKPTGLGVDECCIWGDYFYAEALVRILKTDWKKYW